jgi:hypothetical protein
MSKSILGLLFIFAGVTYGSLAIDHIYNHTLGWLLAHDWIKQPAPDKKSLNNFLGRKPTILLYAAILIIIGLFILWNRNN